MCKNQIKFPDVFSEGLRKCSKIKVTFEFKDHAVSVLAGSFVVIFSVGMVCSLRK